jgi:hypothetical protein
MRLVLVAIHPAPSPQAVPLANAFLQSYLATAVQIETVRADFFLGMAPAVCVEELLRLQPSAVAFSMYVWNRVMCREMATELKRRLPGVTLFAGGPEPTAEPVGVLSCDSFDFLISGEGEVPFAEVCSCLVSGAAVGGIPGVATLVNGSTILSPATPLSDLDLIPSPWLNRTLDVSRYPGILWQLSRGCGFNCDFCFDSRDRHGVRRFSLERIEAELRYFASHAVSQVFVLDSTFNQDARRAKTILRMIRKIAPRIHFHFEVRSEFIDREMAELFAGIACSLQIGLQSADPEVLKGVGRSFRRDDFTKRTMLLNDTGATFGFDLMYGLPGDTLAGFRESLDFALGLYPNHLDIFPLAVLPGTALAARADSIGLNYLSVPPYTLISSPGFSGKDIAAAGKLAAASDIFYTRGRAVAWFNSILDPLCQRPSTFLQQFSEWLETDKGNGINEADLTDDQVWKLQRDFLSSKFSVKKMKRFLPVVLDLLDYHYHYAAALMTPVPKVPSKKELAKIRLMDMPLQLSPSARLVEFSHEILEILEAGAPDVRAFADGLERHGSLAVMYATERGICTESLDACYFDLLKRLDGQTAAVGIIRDLALAPEEARSFLEFAVYEGIVLQPAGMEIRADSGSG